MNQPRKMRGATIRQTAEALNMTSPHAPAWARLEVTKPTIPINAIIAAIFGMDMQSSILKSWPIWQANSGAALS
jgi:hypothetical protein